MNIRQVNDQVSVSEQIDTSHLQGILDNGTELLICNRPDGEAEDQTDFEVIKTEAEKMGLETQLLAFSSYQITNEARDEFVEILRDGKKIHLYCRTGSRSKRLWRAANEICD